MSDNEMAFVHTDGRVFTYKEDVPHTTRDNRKITLVVWETCCMEPTCEAVLTTKTATRTPWEWPAFKPPKFCELHRKLARRAAQTKLIKARTDGLERWRTSPEGQAALAARARDCMGRVERAMYNAVMSLSLADEQVEWREAIRIVKAGMRAPAEGARDTRYQSIVRALRTLQEKGRIRYRNGKVTLLR